MHCLLEYNEKNLVAKLDADAQHHPLYRDEHGHLRFQGSPAALLVHHRYKVQFDDLFNAVDDRQMSVESLMEYCRSVSVTVQYYYDRFRRFRKRT